MILEGLLEKFSRTPRKINEGILAKYERIKKEQGEKNANNWWKSLNDKERDRYEYGGETKH